MITLIVILLIFMVGKYVLNTLFGDMCGNDIVQKVPSPNGEKVAYIFTRDCGATTSSSPQLSILNKDENLPNKSGNTFRSNKEFSIGWLSKMKLRVIYDKNSETYEMDESVNGIEIDYVGK
ncbi:hypothetical protein [Bacillus sp. AFS031507]|uniref:hypothetical protein n=1 Tax=Bacillus sp. AFS031507 TaxID=2033496 RepID=UPI00211F11DE|nr:hypothetical protein [Bacillus sp. AFS031507]